MRPLAAQAILTGVQVLILFRTCSNVQQTLPKVLLLSFMLILPSQSLPIVRPVPGQKVVPIKTQARSATILPNFVGLKFLVHNGKVYHDVVITEDMVGHKLGEFSP